MAEPHTGAMVALVPSRADAARLAVPGGEDLGELHCTLVFLGKAIDIEDNVRARIVGSLRSLVEDAAGPDYDLPVRAEAFSVNVFNPGGEEPCLVLGVGGADLAAVHRLVAEELHGEGSPEQHEPWVPHVTLVYTADPAGRIADVLDRVGPVVFDRLRVAFGGEVTDIPLGRVARESALDTWLEAGRLRERFDPHQLRDHDGKWTGGPTGPAPAAAKDLLKLAGKIDLDSDEKLIGSAKLDGGGGGVRMALTEKAGERMLRLGLGGEGYGRADREEGIAAWDGNPSREPLPKADRQRLNAESEDLDAEYDSASPARQEEITKRLQGIREQLTAGGAGFNGTAKLDEYGTARLADRIRPALAEAMGQAKIQNAAWDEIEALEARGDADPARMAELRRVARADATDTLILAHGIVPGSEWGDVHFSVELDETDPYVLLGVMPKGAPDDWGEDKDWRGHFDVAETRKILRMFDKFSDSKAMGGL